MYSYRQPSYAQLVSESKLFYQRFPFEQIIKYETYITCIAFTLIYHKLTDSNEKV